MGITVLQMKDCYESGVVSRESGERNSHIKFENHFLWDNEESGVGSREKESHINLIIIFYGIL